jgi:hypothetical protein
MTGDYKDMDISPLAKAVSKTVAQVSKNVEETSGGKCISFWVACLSLCSQMSRLCAPGCTSVLPGKHKREHTSRDSCAPKSTRKGHLCRIAIEIILPLCLCVSMCVYLCGYESGNTDFGLVCGYESVNPDLGLCVWV